MPARLGPRDAWVVCVHMRLARTDNRILYSFDNRVLAPYALTYLPCVKKDCLLIRAHAHRTDYRRHRCGDFLGHVGQGGPRRKWAGIFRSVQPLQLIHLLIDLPLLIIDSTTDTRDDAGSHAPSHQVQQSDAMPVRGSYRNMVSRL